MADTTINGLTATTSAVAADEIPMWVTGSAVTRKITKANFLGGAMTGGGTIATGGFTLTVPATGTAALLTSGTWTPTLTFGGGSTGITYGTRVGNYMRVGNLVFVDMSIVLTSKGSSTGSAVVSGLPLTANASAVSGMVLRYIQTMASIVGEVYGIIAASSQAFTLAQVSSSSILGITDANFQNTSRLDMWGVYWV